MRRLVPIAVLAVLCGCEPSTKGININTKTRYYASVRVLNLLADVPAEDTIVAVKGDLGTAFNAVPSPGVSPFQQSAIGDTTAFLSADETTFAPSSVQSTATDQRFTLVETGLTAAGGTPAASIQWFQEPTPQVPAGQALVRFVLGAVSAASAQVSAGSVTLATSATLGTVTDWVPVDPSTQTLTVAGGGTTTSFTLPALAAGALHTYALVGSESGLRLVDITETPDADGTASAPISPSAT